MSYFVKHTPKPYIIEKEDKDMRFIPTFLKPQTDSLVLIAFTFCIFLCGMMLAEQLKAPAPEEQMTVLLTQISDSVHY